MTLGFSAIFEAHNTDVGVSSGAGYVVLRVCCDLGQVLLGRY